MASDIGGVWRTIGGRRVFIKDGQSLQDAMKESGKFNKKNKEEEKKSSYYNEIQNAQTEDEMQKILREHDSVRTNTREESKQFMKEWSEKVKEIRNKDKKEYSYHKKPEDKEQEEKLYQEFKEKGKIGQSYSEYKKQWRNANIDKEKIDKEVSMMSGKDLKEAYNSLEKNDNSYEAKAIRGEYNQRQANEEKFHQTTQSMINNSGSDNDSFTMTNGSREVTVSRDDSGKWVDSDGNKYMGYLSKSDVKSYFKGDWKEAKQDALSKETKGYRHLNENNLGKGYEIEKVTDGGTYQVNYGNDEKKLLIHQDDTGYYVRNGDKKEYFDSNMNQKLEKQGVKGINDLKSSKETNTNTTKNDYNDYYKKENIGTPSNYKAGTIVEVQSAYNEKYSGRIVREATKEEKQNHVNTNLKAYIVKDSNGNESVVADTKIKEPYDAYKGTPYERKYVSPLEASKDPNSAMNKYIRNEKQKKAYKKYLKEHPNSELSFEEFKDLK